MRNAAAYLLKLRGELELKFSPISSIFYLIGPVLLVITKATSCSQSRRWRPLVGLRAHFLLINYINDSGLSGWFEVTLTSSSRSFTEQDISSSTSASGRCTPNETHGRNGSPHLLFSPETLQTHRTAIIVVLRFQLGIGLFGQMGFEVAEIILLPPDFSVSPSPGCGRCRTQRPAQRCR